MRLQLWQNLLIIDLFILIVFLIVVKVKANNEKISMLSVVIEIFLKFASLPDFTHKRDYQKAVSNSVYKLPKKYKNNILNFDGREDVYIINEASINNKVIFYLHGGAYWLQPQGIHFSFLIKLAQLSNAAIIIPVYPKAPVYSAVDTHKMVLDNYLYLINEKKINADNIIIMGDSSGGGLALALIQVLKDKGIALPNQAILLSPWLDVSMSNPNMVDIQVNDPLLKINRLKYAGQVYAGELSCDSPLVSPLYGEISNLVPISIFSGTHDILHADVLKYYNEAILHNIDVTLYTYPKMNHCFALFPIPEREEVLNKIIKIIGK